MTFYNHPAKEAPHDPGDGNHRECFRCGVTVTGFGPTLVHFDEEVRMTAVPREYLPALHDCTQIVEQALSKITDRASDHEVARAVVAALIDERYVRVRRGAPRKTHARR